MSAWNEGYTTDVQYTSFFHAEIAPSHIAFAALMAGQRAPDLSGAFSYCELGSGQGVTLNAIAALHPQARFWGFDFNPAQIANAARLADRAGLGNVQFRDWSFAQALDNEAQLPRFDVIALHGILSWVSEQNREEIVRFIDRTLKPGGIVYASYNTQPGWAQMAPFRQLAREHYLRHPGRSDLHVPSILAFADAFTEIGAAYFKANPVVEKRLEAMRKQPAAYLAHEFLNTHWEAFYVTDIARQMAGARLDYMTSATLIENVAVASLPPGVTAMLADHMPDDRLWQELAKDFACNKMFRRDLYVRGLNPLSATDHAAMLGELRLALAVPREAVKLAFQGPVGEAGGAAAVYDPILDRLAKGAASFGELIAVTPGKDRAKTLQAVTLLVHSKQVLPVADKVDGKAARVLNIVLTAAQFAGESYGVVVAPKARTALQVSGDELMLLGGLLAGRKTAAEAAGHAVERLAANGRAPQQEGKALKGEAAVAFLTGRFAPLMEAKLGVWKDLGII
ncbi:class I SAM-dependent methyltransferase [Caulobacter sp. NIBR2454]|uniref:class I SAM-dependent methyltransferase n=1 Tax=Caulobacter sp. NIBR2454 TaxID=3015996 RepID=UPI0022B6EC36|nr:class I SAM-dependent methyltransferase [Caulobacter sp. NIBR2454]